MTFLKDICCPSIAKHHTFYGGGTIPIVNERQGMLNRVRCDRGRSAPSNLINPATSDSKQACEERHQL